MALLSALHAAIRHDDRTEADGAGEATGRARCRSCGRYYGAAAATCPHCGSGNRLLAGPAGRRHDRY